MSLNIVVEKTARRFVVNGSDGNICIRRVKTHLFVTLLFVVGAMPMAAQSVADLVARYEDLQKRARSEKNFEKARPLWEELYATDQKVCGMPLPELHDAWATEVDHRKKTQLADAVARAAIMQINTIEESDKEKQQELLDLIVEVAKDGQFQQKQIKIDKEPQQVTIQPIHTIESDAEHDWVIRRPTADRIEVWLPRLDGYSIQKERWLTKQFRHAAMAMAEHGTAHFYPTVDGSRLICLLTIRCCLSFRGTGSG